MWWTASKRKIRGRPRNRGTPDWGNVGTRSEGAGGSVDPGFLRLLGTAGMYEERLTERIRDLEGTEARTTKDLSSILDSIIRHLQRLLNTRKGSVPIAEDYGMPEFTNFHGTSFSDHAHDIANSIRDMVLKYEPRLSKAQVLFVSDTNDVLSLKFRIHAEIVHVRDKVIPIELETTISSDGKVRVSE
jgi:type VI secretion system protein